MWLTTVALTMAAAVLRLDGLFDPQVHPDEALFATWARMIGTWRAPLLRGEVVDKPPLLFYLQGAFYPLLGSAQIWVSRLPNLAASILLVPLTMRLSWQLYEDKLSTAVVAILISFSPLLIALGNSSFIDPLLTFLLTAALVCGSARSFKLRRRVGDTVRARGEIRPAFTMGLLMGLALATKYQAALFVPLQIGLGWLHGYKRRAWLWWLAGLVGPLASLGVWSLVRGQASGLWSKQLANYGGLRVAWSWELWPRLEAWGAVWAQLLEAPVLAFGFVLFTPVFLALLIQRQDRSSALDQLLLVFVASYMLLHWFIAVPIWDRYLLPVAPLAILLLGRFVARVVTFIKPAVPLPRGWLSSGSVMLVFALTAPSTLSLVVPLRGSLATRSPEANMDLIAAELSDAPYGTVLYDHWSSWQSRYALLDSKVYVSWFAHPRALVEDVNVFLDQGGDRYLLLPRNASAIPVIRVMDDSGYALQIVRNLGDVVLYRIERQ